MEYNIVKKEQVRQTENFAWKNACDCEECRTQIACHRNSLINLKSYMASWLTEMWDLGTDFQNWINRLTEDIQELTKMIEKYDVLYTEGVKDE